MQLISRTSEYAIRAVIWLVQEPARSQTTRQIAKATRTPPDYISKVLQLLAKAGVVRSQRGLGGGFQLVREPTDSGLQYQASIVVSSELRWSNDGRQKALCRGELSFRLLQFSIMADQAIRRTIVFELGRARALQFGDDALGKHLAQFDAPLVKRIDVPDYALGEDAVLIERDKAPEDLRREPLGEDDIGRAVAIGSHVLRLQDLAKITNQRQATFLGPDRTRFNKSVGAGLFERSSGQSFDGGKARRFLEQ